MFIGFVMTTILYLLTIPILLKIWSGYFTKQPASSNQLLASALGMALADRHTTCSDDKKNHRNTAIKSRRLEMLNELKEIKKLQKDHVLTDDEFEQLKTLVMNDVMKLYR